MSRIRVGSDVRELFRRRVRCWECWDASVGASATGDDRLLFGAADAEHNIIVVESMRVERDSVVTDWDAKYAGSHVEFLQASVVF